MLAYTQQWSGDLFKNVAVDTSILGSQYDKRIVNLTFLCF